MTALAIAYASPALTLALLVGVSCWALGDRPRPALLACALLVGLLWPLWLALLIAHHVERIAPYRPSGPLGPPQ